MCDMKPKQSHTGELRNKHMYEFKYDMLKIY